MIATIGMSDPAFDLQNEIIYGAKIKRFNVENFCKTTQELQFGSNASSLFLSSAKWVISVSMDTSANSLGKFRKQSRLQQGRLKSADSSVWYALCFGEKMMNEIKILCRRSPVGSMVATVQTPGQIFPTKSNMNKYFIEIGLSEDFWKYL